MGLLPGEGERRVHACNPSCMRAARPRNVHLHRTFDCKTIALAGGCTGERVSGALKRSIYATLIYNLPAKLSRGIKAKRHVVHPSHTGYRVPRSGHQVTVESLVVGLVAGSVVEVHPKHDAVLKAPGRAQKTRALLA